MRRRARPLFLLIHTHNTYIHLYIYCSLIIGFIMILSFSPRACSRGHHLLPMEGETEGDQRGTAKGKKGGEREREKEQYLDDNTFSLSLFLSLFPLTLIRSKMRKDFERASGFIINFEGLDNDHRHSGFALALLSRSRVPINPLLVFFFFETRRGWRMKKGTFMHEARSFDPCPFIISLLPASLAGERKLPIVFG